MSFVKVAATVSMVSDMAAADAKTMQMCYLLA